MPRFTQAYLLAACAVVALPTALVAQRARQATDCPEPGNAQFQDPERPTRELPQPQFIRGPNPVYPAALQHRSVAGKVGLQFVVRCDGRADSNTVAVVYATDTAFIRPAVFAVLRSVYRPGLFHGKRVAASVMQVVKFTPPPTKRTKPGT